MERNSDEIELELAVIEEMLSFHGDRLSYYRERKLKCSMELNRARRLARQAKELQP